MKDDDDDDLDEEDDDDLDFLNLTWGEAAKATSHEILTILKETFCNLSVK